MVIILRARQKVTQDQRPSRFRDPKNTQRTKRNRRQRQGGGRNAVARRVASIHSALRGPPRARGGRSFADHRRKGLRLCGEPVGENERGVCHQAGSDRKSTRLNSSHLVISYAAFCLKKSRKAGRCSSFKFALNTVLICVAALVAA